MTVSIPLHSRKYPGLFAVVDDIDAHLEQYRWNVIKRGERYYAIRASDSVLMHRIITNAPKGTDVDHRDGDGLNNTRDNLRLATRAQNMSNRPRHKYPFIGVCKHSRGGWIAQITHHYKHHYLGYYSTPEDAARAYDAKAIELKGEFATLNFPSD